MMTTSLTKFVCNTEESAINARDELIGEGHNIIFGPDKVNYGTTDMTRNGGDNYPYANAWVVIGTK